MRNRTAVYRFGPFELDSGRHCLSRGAEPVALSARLIEILLLLVAHAGQIVSKDALIQAGWDVIVSEHSLTQAIKLLRKALGTRQDGTPYIETMIGRGYRFIAPVEQVQPAEPALVLDTMLAPYSALGEGRAALETLERDAIPRAIAAFEAMLRADPRSVAAHAGMANACFMQFESTRADLTPDLAALQKAECHAREACQLNSASGSAWATLGVVLHRRGEVRHAIAAVSKGIALEPKFWPHHVRLATVTWGEERLLATHRALKLRPGLGLAYLFAAEVFAARQAFGAAIEELRAGCAAQDAERTETGRPTAVGLHLLYGFVLAAQGADDAALEEFARERSFEDHGHVYSREACANAWYGTGAVHLRHDRRDEAQPAFRQALTRVPGHAMAVVGLAAACGLPLPQEKRPHANPVHAAMATAAVRALADRHHDAARVCRDPLLQAEPGSIGWRIVIDPLITATAHLDAWAEILAILRDRAT